MQQSMVRGAEVTALESEFSAFVDGRHCVSAGSATSALQLALLALGIGAGDEVIVPSFGPDSTAGAVQLVGAIPVFADIDPLTFCLDPAAVAAALTPRTAAIVPVHAFGYAAATDQLAALATRHGVALIEDATQAVTAARGGQRAGTRGTLAVLGTGGTAAVATSDLQLALTVRLLRDQRPEEHGLTCEDAAAGREVLAGLVGAVARRRANARFFDSALTGVLVPHVEAGVHHAYDSYVVRVPGNGRPDRDAFARALASRGVRVRAAVRTPVHRLATHRSHVHLPRTEAATADTLALPVGERLTERELTRIAAACNTLGGLL
jgi:perosamine synthetase